MGRMISSGQIPAGTAIFIDANIFIYHFIAETAVSHQCTSLLKQVESNAINGFTSTIVLAEISHRLMVLETIEQYKLTPKNAVRFLKEHPEKVKPLEKHLNAVIEIREMGVKLLPMEGKDIFSSLELQRKYGLLTNDSINLHIMLRDSIFSLASNDLDFEEIDFITLYKPSLVINPRY